MDRLSKLPGEVQSQIAGLLPLKDAASAGLACKTWLAIFFSQLLTTMEFKEEMFVQRNQPLGVQSAQRIKFIGFVRTWLRYYQPPTVQNLSISLSGLPYTQFATTMFDNSVLFSSTKLVESFLWDSANPLWNNGRRVGRSRVVMPEVSLQQFNYGVLEKLKLFCCKVNAIGLSPFGSLRDLSLGWMELRGSVLQLVLKFCPALENLHLKGCWSMDVEYIHGRELRNLTIEKCHFDDDNAFTIEINAPELQCYHYSGDFRTTDNMHSENMEELYLKYGFETQFNMYGDIFCELLEQHFHIGVLTVDSYILQVLPTGFAAQTDPPLELRRLKWITGMHRNEFFGYAFFLKSCPQMETLTIEIKRTRVLEDYEPPQELPVNFWDEELIFVQCLQQSLRFVDVEGFKGTPNEIHFLTYLVRFGMAMEKMMLRFPKGRSLRDNDAYALRARFLSRHVVPRASPNLRIFFERDR